MPGRSRSRTTTSYALRSSLAAAASPSCATSTAMPWSRRPSATTSASARASSTTSTLTPAPGRRRRQRDGRAGRPRAGRAGPGGRRARRRWPRRSTARARSRLRAGAVGAEPLERLRQPGDLAAGRGRGPPVSTTSRASAAGRRSRRPGSSRRPSLWMTALSITLSTIRASSAAAAPRPPASGGTSVGHGQPFRVAMSAARAATARDDQAAEGDRRPARRARRAARGPARGSRRAAGRPGRARCAAGRPARPSAAAAVRLGHRHVQRRPHGRQRGAQLVRGVGDEPALRGERRLQPFQQPVDGVGEVLDLVGRARHGQPLVQVVGGDPPGRRGDRRSGRSTRPASTRPSSTETTAITASATSEPTSSCRDCCVVHLGQLRPAAARMRCCASTDAGAGRRRSPGTTLVTLAAGEQVGEGQQPEPGHQEHDGVQDGETQPHGPACAALIIAPACPCRT